MDDEIKPPKVPPILKSYPRIREFYWCDFPKDAQLPELWKLRPVIILSKTAKLNGAVTIVPCSTKAQNNPDSVFALETTIDGRAAFAICDKITTVAVSRLRPADSGIRRMPQEEFIKMLKIIYKFLPLPPTDNE